MYRARSTADACAKLAELGEDTTVYAGGTELLIAMKLGIAHYLHLVDVKEIGELRTITAGTDSVDIGACVTHRQLSSMARLPGALALLPKVASRIGNPRVRTAGTIGGSLCFGDPRSDLAIVTAALDGECELASPDGTRTVPVADLIATPYAADIQHAELLTKVRLGAFSDRWRFAYQKIQWHERPLMGLAVGWREAVPGMIAEGRLALGGGDVPPQRFRVAEKLLSGPTQELGERVAEVAASVNSAAAWADGEGYSALYKAHLLSVLLRRTVMAAQVQTEKMTGSYTDD
jgi:carbon-monoxide dehydrogenase medium subunit